MPCPWDIPIPLQSESKVPVYHRVNIETDIFMSPGHIFVAAHNMRARDITIPIHSVSLLHVHLGVEIETYDIFMSPGHILVLVHTHHAMSLGHTGNLHSV